MSGSDYVLLRLLRKNPSASQRQMAKETGISLGRVNSLLQENIARGRICTQNETAALRYVVTEDGGRELEKKVLERIGQAYNTVQDVQVSIQKIARKHAKEGKTIYIAEAEDSLAAICKKALEEENISYTQGRPAAAEDHAVVFWWEENQRGSESRAMWVNVLGVLEEKNL